jgi:TM2 domain-containing membrane protein YozV
LGKLIAAALSLVIIGAGQIYNFEYLKGTVLLILALIIYRIHFPFWPYIVLLLWIISILDAYNNGYDRQLFRTGA